MLLNTKGFEDRVGLWTVANQFTYLVKVFVDIKGSNMDTTLCRLNFTSQVFKGGRFASTIDAKQGEALS